MDQTDPTRPHEIAPIVPDLTDCARPDGGDPMPPPTPGRRPERPPQTDYASPYTRDEEELEPLVPDLR